MGGAFKREMKNTLRVAVMTVLMGGTAFAQAMLQGSRYVAMGSSYAAGPGVGTPDPTGVSCQRSSSNFAHIFAAKHHLTLVDVSCSSAMTENILEHGQHGLPAQIDAVTADTKFVSVLIGGNDIDYVGNLLGLSCRHTAGTNCHIQDAGEVEAKLASLPASLDRVIAEVRRRAPQAHIVLVGYLPVLPANNSSRCAAVPLSPPDAQRMRGIAIRLAQVIGGAAQRNHTGIVRSTLLGEGHDSCSAEPYVAGYYPARTPGWPSPIKYHPNQAGMDAVARALESELIH